MIISKHYSSMLGALLLKYPILLRKNRRKIIVVEVFGCTYYSRGGNFSHHLQPLGGTFAPDKLLHPIPCIPPPRNKSLSHAPLLSQVDATISVCTLWQQMFQIIPITLWYLTSLSLPQNPPSSSPFQHTSPKPQHQSNPGRWEDFWMFQLNYLITPKPILPFNEVSQTWSKKKKMFLILQCGLQLKIFNFHLLRIRNFLHETTRENYNFLVYSFFSLLFPLFSVFHLTSQRKHT